MGATAPAGSGTGWSTGSTRRSVAVDLPGRGGRPADLMTLTLDQHAASVVTDLLAAAPDGPVVVVAHSSGGLIVPRVIAALGDRVTAVVLTSASVPPEGGTGLDCMKAESPGADGGRHRAGPLGGPAPGRPGARRSPRPCGRPTANASTTTPWPSCSTAWSRTPSTSTSTRCPGPGSPCRSPMSGPARDTAVPPALQDEMIGHLPGAPTVLDWDCGHIPPVTRPDEFADLLRQFLN